MTTNDHQPGDSSADLRRRAEERLLKNEIESAELAASLSPDDVRRTIHELHVHQVELEMQNEELRRAFAEIDAVRARYFDLYDLAPSGYLTISAEGLVLEANLTIATLLGIARCDLINKPFSRFILKDDHSIYYRFHKQICETGRATACELRLVRPDALPFTAHVLMVASGDAAGAPVCRMMIANIDERKRNEEALRLGHAQLLAVLDADPELVYVADPVTHELLYVNKRFLDTFGPPGQRRCYEHLQQRSKPCPFCTNEKIFGANVGKVWTWEFQNESNGRWYRCYDRAITWVDGRCVRYEMAVDFTEHKRAEENLRQKNAGLERFNALAINREMRMIELKQEVNALLQAAGQPLKYTASRNT